MPQFWQINFRKRIVLRKKGGYTRQATSSFQSYPPRTILREVSWVSPLITAKMWLAKKVYVTENRFTARVADAIFRRERGDDPKCVCSSQATLVLAYLSIHVFTTNIQMACLLQAIWYYAMVRFCTIDLKLHLIAQFEENRIIPKKKMLNSSKVNNKF